MMKTHNLKGVQLKRPLRDVDTNTFEDHLHKNQSSEIY